MYLSLIYQFSIISDDLCIHISIYVLPIYFFIYDKIATWFAGKKFMKTVTIINLNVLNYLESTSLHYASEKGHQSVVELLLDRGANIDQKGKYGEFILYIYLCIYRTFNLSFP